MARALILIVLFCGGALLLAPLVLGSLYVDQRGVQVPGHVYSKSEYLRLQHTSWSRESEVTFELTDPASSSARFFSVSMDPARYDTFHKGQAVQLHYLRREDVPKLPGADVMWELHILPTVRLAEDRAFMGFRRTFTPGVTLACEAVLGIVIVLWLWRRSRWPGFKWAFGTCIVCGLIVLMLYDFPRPTPAPVGEVHQATGKVKNLRRIDYLFSTRRSRGAEAHQPIDVVGVEFLPQGWKDPVLAVDLVDRAGLADGSVVEVDYEAATPRTAQIRGATREFVRRNVIGLFEDGALIIALLIGLAFLWAAIGKWWRWLVGRRGPSPLVK